MKNRKLIIECYLFQIPWEQRGAECPSHWRAAGQLPSADFRQQNWPPTGCFREWFATVLWAVRPDHWQGQSVTQWAARSSSWVVHVFGAEATGLRRGLPVAGPVHRLDSSLSLSTHSRFIRSTFNLTATEFNWLVYYQSTANPLHLFSPFIWNVRRLWLGFRSRNWFLALVQCACQF